MEKIAMLGCRDLSLCHPEAKGLFRQAATHFGRQGFCVVTLPSRGGCQLAAASALVVGGTVELIVPYPEYNKEWVEAMRRENGERVVPNRFDSELHQEWIEADHILHPAHRHLGGTDTGFFASVFGIVEGSDALIALPHRGEQGVEVAPAIHIARALGKPLLVLSKEGDRQELEAMLQ